jgi:hypothetical protein
LENYVTNSPLGRYAPVTAAATALGIVGAWIATEVLAALGPAFGWPALNPPAGLKEAALLALGAVFGSAVAVNGYKAPLAAAHKRLDLIDAPPADDGGL